MLWARLTFDCMYMYHLTFHGAKSNFHDRKVELQNSATTESTKQKSTKYNKPESTVKPLGSAVNGDTSGNCSVDCVDWKCQSKILCC